MSFFQNTCKPKGFGGRIMVSMMNIGHTAMAEWGFRHLSIKEDASVLDVGCGGGANIKRLLKKCPIGRVKGIDYSEVSVEKSRALNAKAIQAGRCEVLHGSVMELPFALETFDVVTAFETVYFWPDLVEGLRQVHKVLKPKGQILICNEVNGENAKDEKWAKIIEGMTIYNTEKILSALWQVGFTNAQVDKNQKGWICIVAEKE